jgi:hypothetical protein
MECGIGSGTNQVGIPDQVHSSDNDWDLEFPPNLEIEDFPHTSEDESSDSEGREAKARANCSYIDLHVVHEHKASRGCRRDSGGGAMRVAASNEGVGSTSVGNVGRKGCVDSSPLLPRRLSPRGRARVERTRLHGRRLSSLNGLELLSHHVYDITVEEDSNHEDGDDSIGPYSVHQGPYKRSNTVR